MNYGGVYQNEEDREMQLCGQQSGGLFWLSVIRLCVYVFAPVCPQAGAQVCTCACGGSAHLCLAGWELLGLTWDQALSWLFTLASARCCPCQLGIPQWPAGTMGWVDPWHCRHLGTQLQAQEAWEPRPAASGRLRGSWWQLAALITSWRCHLG